MSNIKKFTEKVNQETPIKKIFFDTEFTGLYKNTTLISIGFITDCGKTFYAELSDYDDTKIDDWLKENVIDKLVLSGEYKNTIVENDIADVVVFGDKQFIKIELEKWFKQFKKVEIWSDCLSYDWVLFCDIFEHSFNIPKNIYYIPFDICTSFRDKNIDPDINREEYAQIEDNSMKHNSLWDAKIIKACYDKLYDN